MASKPKSATPNPLDNSIPTSPPSISKQEFKFAGLVTHVYGLEEIPHRFTDVACLWLLHPRLSKKEHMQPLAARAIAEWNNHLSRGKAGSPQGLIAVAFDQRNHGSRLIDKLANEAWRQGNPNHAQDMYSIYQSTAADTSLLINYLPAFLFPHDERRITSHMVMGVSLGAHAAWHCVLHDERIKTAIIVIGCADYVRLMSDRAAKSKLQTWHSSEPPGSKFLGSKDFPRSLLDIVEKTDPASLLMGEMDVVTGNDHVHEPSESEKRRLIPLMKTHLQDKKILNLSGGADKLVPYKCSKPFLRWLENAIGPEGWFAGHGTVLKDVVFDGIGHQMSPGMVDEAMKFLLETSMIATQTSRI